ncbi:hypothetical protein F5Y16DRAFT_366771 [Xylariaceae sp. FL0255]|nr:hypothetical protein F5Y16DRAFT_366771 [Xylariaceae sp. FL0255]
MPSSMGPIRIGTTTRQKSCNACARGKRRCDQRQPSCSRYIKQRYLCIYGGQTYVPLGNPAGNAQDPLQLDIFSNLMTSNPSIFVPAPPQGIPDSLDTGLIQGPNFQIDSLFNSMLVTMLSDNSLTPNPWPAPPDDVNVFSTGKSVVRKDYSNMPMYCVDYAPWQLSDPTSKPYFTKKIFQRVHVTFAEMNGTLYMHRHLYKDDTPRWILQAFSISLLYMNQTELNRGVCLRVLHDNVIELKETASSTTNFMPKQKLARVHALMIYQLIRMLDGDVTLSSQADKDFALLESWTADLIKIRDNLDGLACMSQTELREHPTESWERWIFTESLRRTIIMAQAIKKGWDLMKDCQKPKITDEWEFAPRWTLSSHLWNANSSFEFFRAWKEKPQWIIQSFKFDEFMKTGTGDDLDDFGLFFISIYFGVSEIKTFCYETSGRILTI